MTRDADNLFLRTLRHAGISRQAAEALLQRTAGGGSAAPVANANEVVFTQSGLVVPAGSGAQSMLFDGTIDAGGLGFAADPVNGHLTAPEGLYKVQVYANFGADLSDGDQFRMIFFDGHLTEDIIFNYSPVSMLNEISHTFLAYLAPVGSAVNLVCDARSAADPTVYCELHLRPLFEVT